METTAKNTINITPQNFTSPVLQVIFSTYHDGQFIGNYPFAPEQIENKESFIAFCNLMLMAKYNTMPMDDYLKANNPYMQSPSLPKFSKLSACIYFDGAEPTKIPKWYNESNGKVYFNEDGSVR